MLCCESSRKCHHAAQTMPTWTKPILTCFYKIDYYAAIHGRIRMNNVPTQSRLIMLSCTAQFCYIIFFQFWEIWSQTRVSFYATQSSYLLKTWREKKSNFDMFYENDCWAVICYPICMINVSYERGIIVLSFPDISFVILLFDFQRFELNLGFPFLNSHCYTVDHCSYFKFTDTYIHVYLQT